MADTVESLRAELNKLRAEFEQFRSYAKPVIDGHQPPKDPLPSWSDPQIAEIQSTLAFLTGRT